MGARCVTGMLQGVPGDFEQQSLLRIQPLGACRGIAKELGVEVGDTVEPAKGADEIRISKVCLRKPCRQQFRVRRFADCRDPLGQIVPIGVNVHGAW